MPIIGDAENANWEIFTPRKMGDTSGLSDNRLWTLYPEETGKVLVWSGDGRLSRLGEHWETVQKLQQPSFYESTKYVNQVVRGEKGRIWFGADKKREALQWAKTRGPLDQPLYVFLIDHGGTDKFQLSQLTNMGALKFDEILDDYQNTTGNQIVLIIDACHSGSLLKQLMGKSRAVISSSDHRVAYFDRLEKQGFSRFLANGLLRGMSFFEAFEYASQEQTDMLGGMFSQAPQFEDNQDGKWLRRLFINGSFVAGDLTLAVKGLTSLTTLPAGQALSLQAQVSLASGQITRVWAVLRPPKVNVVMDSHGTPILPFPHLRLFPTDDDGIWETTWRDAVYNGDYKITFYAQDNQGNVASSDNTLVISVIGGTK